MSNPNRTYAKAAERLIAGEELDLIAENLLLPKSLYNAVERLQAPLVSLGFATRKYLHIKDGIAAMRSEPTPHVGRPVSEVSQIVQLIVAGSRLHYPELPLSMQHKLKTVLKPLGYELKYDMPTGALWASKSYKQQSFQILTPNSETTNHEH